MNQNTFQNIHQNYLNLWISLVEELHSLENKWLLQELLFELSQEYVKTLFGTLEKVKVKLSEEEIHIRNLLSWEELKQKLFQDIAKYKNHNVKIQSARQLVDILFPDNQYLSLPDIQWTVEDVWNVILPPDTLDIFLTKSSLDQKERPIWFDKIGLLEKCLSEWLNKERNSFNWKKGILHDNQMRKISYYYLYLLEFDKTIILNNQYWESSFVLNGKFDVDYFCSSTKSMIKEIGWIIIISFDYKNPLFSIEKFKKALLENVDSTSSKYNTIEKRSYAPKGWMTNRWLSIVLGVDKSVTKKIANNYKWNASWFRRYLDWAGQQREHYSPELCELISNEIQKTSTKAPEWWHTRSWLAKKAGVDIRTIENRIDQYKSHSEWFWFYKSTNNQLKLHYAPELCKIVLENWENIWEKAPEWWMTQTWLAKLLNTDGKTIKKKVFQYKNEHPEWFKKYLNNSNKWYEHYSPKLCRIIMKKFSWERVPQWRETNFSLCQKLKVHFNTIKKKANDYRNSHPERFKEYLNENNQLNEYFSPELCKLIIEEVSKKNIN